MGKKYIIELERGETAYKTVDSNGTPLIQLLAPTPYAAPDLEQIRKEAYKEGREAGFGRKIDASYQEGLNDAWEAARRIGSDSRYGLEKMGFKFEPRAVGDDPGWYVVQRYSASECIKRIRLATILEKM